MHNFRRYAATVAAFATMFYGALVVAAFGMISLLLDRDVITDPSAGPLVGPVMTVVAVGIVLAVLLNIGLRVREDRQRIALGAALLTGLASYFFFGVAGALLIGIGSGDPIAFLTFLALQLVSPFAIAAGVLAFVVTILYMLILASKVGDKGRPRWPWERYDEDE
ncbi:DUF6121 family protein [Rathayibacter soli]|uniref:DUF6121 family protein n=1 Tax=Rathayibacter soli TaxID=3144168 RepID=UPI0027E4927D|nr:DUF6121 family protein [Glaciibacter superstes]